MKKWKVKRETTNLLKNNNTSEIYLEKFLSNSQVAKKKECDIWLDDGTIMSEHEMKKAQISLGRLQIQQTYRKQGNL